MRNLMVFLILVMSTSCGLLKGKPDCLNGSYVSSDPYNHPAELTLNADGGFSATIGASINTGNYTCGSGQTINVSVGSCNTPDGYPNQCISTGHMVCTYTKGTSLVFICSGLATIPLNGVVFAAGGN